MSMSLSMDSFRATKISLLGLQLNELVQSNYFTTASAQKTLKDGRDSDLQWKIEIDILSVDTFVSEGRLYNTHCR